MLYNITVIFKNEYWLQNKKGIGLRKKKHPLRMFSLGWGRD